MCCCRCADEVSTQSTLLLIFFFFLNNLLSAFFSFQEGTILWWLKKKDLTRSIQWESAPPQRGLCPLALSAWPRQLVAGRCMAQCSPSPLCDLECCRTTRYPVFLISAKVNKVDLKTPVTRSLHTECTSMVTQTLCVHCSSDNVC